jgi:RNA polymerase sigma factor (sigma-70 family)
MAGTELDPTTGWPELYTRLRRDPADPIAHAELRARSTAWARQDLWSRGWHAIEDVVADTVETVWVRLDQARGPDTFRGFVMGHYLNAKRQVTRPSLLPVVPLTEDFDAVDPRATSEAEGLGDQELELLRGALAALPNRERAAVELHYLEDLSYREIGAILQVNENNARQISSRGRARLERYLEEVWPGARARCALRGRVPDAV